jgi:hypothetical protein
MVSSALLFALLDGSGRVKFSYPMQPIMQFIGVQKFTMTNYLGR